MRKTTLMSALALGIWWVGLTGCTKPVVREKPLPDPLLTSKKPIEGKPAASSSISLAGWDFSRLPEPPALQEPTGVRNPSVVNLLPPQQPR
ncbi:MAG: hypothetical protein ACKO23_20135 [Gemmataceae bacterium]